MLRRDIRTNRERIGGFDPDNGWELTQFVNRWLWNLDQIPVELQRFFNSSRKLRNGVRKIRRLGVCDRDYERSRLTGNRIGSDSANRM